jgi:hypothetical protein
LLRQNNFPIFYGVCRTKCNYFKNKFALLDRIILSLLKQNETPIQMTTSNKYAKIEFNGSKTYMVVDSANQCRFATSSEKKAKNFLARLLKESGTNN